MFLKKLFNSKKASVLVEKILTTAFAVAMGASVIVYGGKVINDSKKITVDMPVGYNSNGVELIPGHYYKFKREMGDQDFRSIVKEDMEYFLVSNVYDSNGNERFISGGPSEVFFGYTNWHIDEDNKTFFLEDPSCCGRCLCSYYSEKTALRAWGQADWWYDDSKPRLNCCGCDGGFDYYDDIFKCGGIWVRQGNGPKLIEYLEEVELPNQ